MTLDMSYFGNGAGLVMIGFIAGMVMNFYFQTFLDVRRGV